MMITTTDAVIMKRLARFGFSFKRGGVHTARTLMLNELSRLFACVSSPDAGVEDYSRAIVQGNCLDKPTGETRRLSRKHLKDLYGLDSSLLVFRGLRYFWECEEAGRPLMALLCAFSRDPLLRAGVPFIFSFYEGQAVGRIQLEAFIDGLEPKRFSPVTLTSLAQNLNSTWTQSGHLCGRARKVRSKPVATPGAAAYALFLSYISGDRGVFMVESEFSRLLDCSQSQVIELAQAASLNGWMVFKHISDVVEVAFPRIIHPQELE